LFFLGRYTGRMKRQLLLKVQCAILLIAAVLAAAETKKSKSFTPTHDIRVKTVKTLIKEVRQAKPGTEIVLAAGEYALQSDLNVSARGSEAEPVVIRAAQVGKTLITKGAISFNDASWVTLEGITIKTTPKDGEALISVNNSEHIRISRINFQISGDADTDYVSLEDAQDIQVDRCDFGKRAGKGNYVHVARPSSRVRIDHNYFHDRNKVEGNGGESISLHGQHGHRWDMDTVIEHNLFENVDGEWEMIGIKSHQNIVRHNTFINCSGAISIRGGDYNTIYSNYFLNFSEKPTAAVRIHGAYNKVINNYASGLTTSFIETNWGDTSIPYISRNDRIKWWGEHSDVESYAIQETGYRRTTANTIAFNTIIDSTSLFRWIQKSLVPFEQLPPKKAPWVDASKDRVIYPPDHWTVANNLVVDVGDFIVEESRNRGDMPFTEAAAIHEKDFTWIGNAIFSKSGAVDYGEGRTFQTKEWRIQKQALEQTSVPGLFETAPKLSSTRFRPTLGEADDDLSEVRRLLGSTEIGASLAAPPLTADAVGPDAP